jgi:hypothetical protein
MKPVPAPTPTPLTVANVCSFNPGLGHVYFQTAAENLQIGGPGWPVAYWLNSKGELIFLAAATEGGTAVTVAIIPIAPNSGTPAYAARCEWANWLTVAEYQQQLEQANLTTYVPGSQVWWQELAPSMEALNGLAAEDYTPSVGVSVCSFDTSSECDYEPGY